MIVLDTHVLIWWVNGDGQLSPKARAAIEHEQRSDDGIILVSAISAWEIAMLVARDRLVLGMNLDDWLGTVREIECVRIVPVDEAVGIGSTRLPGEFHKDPADRMITALARHYNVPLVTADERIRAYKHVRSIW